VTNTRFPEHLKLFPCFLFSPLIECAILPQVLVFEIFFVAEEDPHRTVPSNEERLLGHRRRRINGFILFSFGFSPLHFILSLAAQSLPMSSLGRFSEILASLFAFFLPIISQIFQTDSGFTILPSFLQLVRPTCGGASFLFWQFN